MSDLPPDFDLRMLPDWLKETGAKNPYADYEMDARDRPSRGDSRERRSGPPRQDRQRSPRPQRRDERGERDRKGAPPRREDSGTRAPTPSAPPPPVELTIEFGPEEGFVSGIAKQIRAASRAWPLFNLAKLFLEKPERHRVRISTTQPDAVLWQIGENGPVTLDRALAERSAFEQLRDNYYLTETVQQEPPKGNFSSVARCGITGTLLGPTSWHGYQPALRKHYDERFSRRMSFPDYLKNIETISNPAAVEDWKENARNVTSIKTVGEGEPVVFRTMAEAEQHFRTNHLATALRSGRSFELAGETSRRVPDQRIASSIRQAWEQERNFPGGMMHRIRQQLTALHVFKHRKRMQFITTVRPIPMVRDNLSPNILAILEAIEGKPGCTRGDLAARVLGENTAETARAALAADLHWLVNAGHVIEFHDGRLDLPLARPETTERVPPPESAAKEAEPTTTAAASPGVQEQ